MYNIYNIIKLKSGCRFRGFLHICDFEIIDVTGFNRFRLKTSILFYLNSAETGVFYPACENVLNFFTEPVTHLNLLYFLPESDH